MQRELRGSIVVLRPHGHLFGDLGSSELRQAICVSQAAGLAVILDWSDTQYLGADSLAVVEDALNHVQVNGPPVVMAGATGRIAAMLKFLKSPDQPIFPTVDAAEAVLNKA